MQKEFVAFIIVKLYQAQQNKYVGVLQTLKNKGAQTMPPGVAQVGKYHNRKRHNFMPLVIRHGYRILLLVVISNYYSIGFTCQGF